MFSFFDRGCYLYRFIFVVIGIYHSVYTDSTENGVNITFDANSESVAKKLILKNESSLFEPINEFRPFEPNFTLDNTNEIPYFETESLEKNDSLFVKQTTLLPILEIGSTKPITIQNLTRNPNIEYVTSPSIKITTLKSATTKNSSCHSECLSALDQMTFTRTPNDFYLEEGKSLNLECSIPLNENFTVTITWLFQGVCPPKPQCSLTAQDTLPLCPDFALKDHYTDVNYTAGYLKEQLILKNLNEKDSGIYICMVELLCCSASHVMDRSIETEKPIVIYYENYALEIGILSGAIMLLAILIVVGTIVQTRYRKRRLTVNIEEVKRPILDDVLHIPILERSDSFDDSDQE